MKTKTNAAKAAKLIRSMLKKQYPKIKFSVTSKGYAGGNHVNVSWNDAFPASTLKSFLRQFEYGEFDSTTDSYKVNNIRPFPQARYVFSHRDITNYDSLRAEAIQLLVGKYGVKDGLINGRYVNEIAARVLNNFDFTNGSTIDAAIRKYLAGGTL